MVFSYMNYIMYKKFVSLVYDVFYVFFTLVLNNIYIRWFTEDGLS